MKIDPRTIPSILVTEKPEETEIPCREMDKMIFWDGNLAKKAAKWKQMVIDDPKIDLFLNFLRKPEWTCVIVIYLNRSSAQHK